MGLDPYLNFNGNCRAAFDYYREVFGGEFMALMTFGDGPEDFPSGADEKDKLMHVSLPVGDSMLMGSDVPAAMAEQGFVAGTNVQVSHRPDDRADADAKFAKLSEGGVVQMPMADQFWGSYFGSCTDKFGIHWMLNLPAE